ncbi:hypothetical protein [Kitasatospora sp. CB01950]|uniref:hypothetical protein n=1 Tax=Kitasatospora sp. CB01950 TaxID=1703930 RepID=UPI00093A2997|nr:hypothetical protein [Kitasatospora sp. CB01950]OKJ05636.1 hypothetical protein AMK19_25415 [Kitasatospora sp. CB01950]
MRAIKRVLALGALTAPLVIGCAGLAAADEPSAHFSQSQFVANEDGAGEAGVSSVVSPNCVEHIKGWVWSGDEGVTGSFSDSGAHF